MLPEYGLMAFSIGIGAETAFDGEPATFRLALSGDSDFAASEKIAVALAMPISFITDNDQSDGVSVKRTLFELPASLRLRVLPAGIVRPYGDVGAGVAVVISNTIDEQGVSDKDQLTGFMTRAALGVELGPKGRGFLVAVEPLSTRTYYLNSTYAALGFMVGVGYRI